MKLTKGQKEFLQEFAASNAAATILIALAADGQDIDKNTSEKVLELCKAANLTPIVDALGRAIEENDLDLKNLIQVNKAMKKPEVVKATQDATVLGTAIQSLVLELIQSLQGE